MTASWVAGTVRAAALAQRRLGAPTARSLAATSGLEAAVATLARTPYGHDVQPGGDLAQAQLEVARTMLWHLRVLAGWLPRDGAQALRVLAGGFEIANLDEHLHRGDGATAEEPYRLGTLQIAWSRLAATTSVDQVHQVLTSSAWGDPGPDVRLGVRLAWAQLVVGSVPGAAGWARAAAALLLVRRSLLAGCPPSGRPAEQSRDLLGHAFTDALRGSGVAELTALLPRDTRWVLEPVRRPGDLWRAETGWWRRVEQEASAALRDVSFTFAPVLGAVGVLACDARRVRAALGAAARGPAALEVFDAVA